MNILSTILIAIITGYIAITSAIADQIISWLPAEEPAAAEVVEGEELTLLPSVFGRSIPDILLKSAAYQQAALGSAGLTGRTTTEPLDALVNIFCTLTTDKYIKTTTGSGFFIDPDGIIMTNAHVAQFLLLEQTDSFGDAECIIRTGSPAAERYEANLLYLPPAWVQENAGNLSEQTPLGTGERDYALLYVSESITDEPLPAMFPALDVATELLSVSVRNNLVVAVGYPATDLIRNGANTSLFSRKADTSISELYTFGSNYADVIAIRGSAVGAEGASGGPVLDENGTVIGLIATRGDDITDGDGSLRAITLSHINRTMQEETGRSLTDNLNGDLRVRSEVFRDTMAPFLLSILQENN